jgi:agmatinase
MIQSVKPVLVGLPYDASSSFMRGSAAAPPAIRSALWSAAGNPWSERLVQVSPDAVEDAGDLPLALHEPAEARAAIEHAIARLAGAGRRFIALGGDHSVTYPILRGLDSTREPVTVLHIDAHPDLYDVFEGDRFSHACPFARVMEEGLASRLVQVGIRAMTGHQRDQARRYGVEQIDMRGWSDGARPSIAGPVYLSLDVDGLDPAFAPGVSHREPGGLSVRDLLWLIASSGGQLVGADVVELNPVQDTGGMTAGVAAKLVREIAARMIEEAAGA